MYSDTLYKYTVERERLSVPLYLICLAQWSTSRLLINLIVVHVLSFLDSSSSSSSFLSSEISLCSSFSFIWLHLRGTYYGFPFIRRRHSSIATSPIVPVHNLLSTLFLTSFQLAVGTQAAANPESFIYKSYSDRYRVKRGEKKKSLDWSCHRLHLFYFYNNACRTQNNRCRTFFFMYLYFVCVCAANKKREESDM